MILSDWKRAALIHLRWPILGGHVAMIFGIAYYLNQIDGARGAWIGLGVVAFNMFHLWYIAEAFTIDEADQAPDLTPHPQQSDRQPEAVLERPPRLRGPK